MFMQFISIFRSIIVVSIVYMYIRLLPTIARDRLALFYIYQVIANYGSGQIGSVYKDGWHEVTHTFTNYGPGVRTVAFCSKGSCLPQL